MADLLPLLLLPFWGWLILAGLLLLGELLTGTTYLIYPSAAAALTGLARLGGLDGHWSFAWLLFGGLTLGLALLLKPYVERWVREAPSEAPDLNEAGRRIGRSATVIEAFRGGAGRVRLGDTDWPAEASSDLAVGAIVRVTDVRGATLIVA